MAKEGTGMAIVNSIRAGASKAYRDAVPELGLKNLLDVKSAILDFTPTYNEFISVFFNKIALSLMDMRAFSNPFRSLVKGGNPLGGVIQDTHVNPAIAIPYDINATSRLLHNYRPDVAVEYFTLNRKDLFAVTRARDELELAFTSFDALDEFFAALIDSLYSGNEIREFELWKALFASAYLSNVFKTVAVAAPVDQETAMKFLLTLQNISFAMTFPSGDYNNFQELAAAQNKAVNPAITWTPQANQIIIMDSRYAATIGLYVKASAFNVSYTELEGRILYVDNLMVTGLLAIICDERAPQVRDNRREFRDFENGATLTLNSFFHVWQYYNIRLWANAVALYDPTAEKAVITVNNGQQLSIGLDTKKQFDYSVAYQGREISPYLSFTTTTNNLVMSYDPEEKKITVATSKDSAPGEYTVLVSARVDIGDGKFETNSALVTVKINPV